MSSEIDTLKLEMRPFVKRSVTTGPGNVGGTTLIDNALTEPDNFWNGMAILIRTGDCAGELRRVLDYDLATNTITVNVAFSAQIAAAVQYVMFFPTIQPTIQFADRSEPITLVDGITFNNVVVDYTSGIIDCATYKKFGLTVHKTVAGAPTTLEIQVQHSADGVNWFHYTRGPFGYLAWEDTAGTEDETIDGDIVLRYLRLYVIAVGTTALLTFTLTAAVQLMT